jgi:hypothetical protein
MGRMDYRLFHRSLLLLLALCLCSPRVITQQSQEIFSHPPNSFSAEDDRFPEEAPIPDCVRHSLARDENVMNTLEYKELSADEIPQGWFTAYQEQTRGYAGTLLVVMGAGLMRGANINSFWIFTDNAGTCSLLLSVGAHDLEVLMTTTNGLPDIKISALTAVRQFENRFSFDGHVYQELKRSSQPIAEDIPHNLREFDTRRPLIQAVGQSPEPILSQARAWLWRQWWLERPSYVKVVLRSKEGDISTSTYFITKTQDELGVTIQTHKVVIDRASRPGHRRALISDEIYVAADVERRWALRDRPDRAAVVPEDKNPSPDAYELYLTDDSGDNVATL